jgi:hypothetical protein
LPDVRYWPEAEVDRPNSFQSVPCQLAGSVNTGIAG